MLPSLKSYEELRAAFRWNLPKTYNIAQDACDNWANTEPERTALLHVLSGGAVEEWSYGQLKGDSNRLANALRALGVAVQDRVALLLPQAPETAISHLAVYKLGAIAVPLAALFGPEALRYRLVNAGAKVVITNQAGLEKLCRIRDDLPFLEHIICVDGEGIGALSFPKLLEQGSDQFEVVRTCLMILP